MKEGRGTTPATGQPVITRTSLFPPSPILPLLSFDFQFGRPHLPHLRASLPAFPRDRNESLERALLFTQIFLYVK